MLRLLQQGTILGMPHSFPMPTVGRRVSELHVRDAERVTTWRILDRVDADMLVVREAFEKKTGMAPGRIIDTCKQRVAELDPA